MKKVMINGMSCGHCANHVKEALTEIGATNINVDLAGKCATFDGEISDEEVKNAIEDYGYEVVGIN